MARHQVPKAGFIGMGGLACLAFLSLGTANIAPWWVTALLFAMCVLLFVVGGRWFTRAPGRVPWLAVAGIAVWFVTVVVGTSRLGWRA